jgi:hypothetical protein
MMPAPLSLGGQSRRLMPTFTALGILAATVLVVFPPMYAVGKRDDDERRFLRNYRAPNEYEAFASYPINYALESHEANDVIFVGDSSLRCDVRTTQFEEETGLRAYNLGNAGLLGLSGQTEIVKAYLSKHPRPRLLVLCILPTTLATSNVEFRPQEEQDVKSRFLWCFGPGTENMRPHNSYLYHVRQGFKYSYGLLVGGFDRFANAPVPSRGGETYRTLEQAVIKERGYWAPPERRKGATLPPKKDPAADPFSVCDEFKKDFTELMRVVADHGVPVLVRMPPWERASSELSPSIRAWAEELESKNPRVKVARPEILVYEPGLFYDGDHLTAKGAETFTRLVSAEVKQVLARE